MGRRNTSSKATCGVSTANVVRTSCDSNGTLPCLGLIEYARARSDSLGASIVAPTDLVVLHRPVELAQTIGLGIKGAIPRWVKSKTLVELRRTVVVF
jgi:hypothetical protein